MPPSFPPACNCSPQAFTKPCLGKWGKHPVLPQTVFLHFKFWGEEKCSFGGFVVYIFFPASLPHGVATHPRSGDTQIPFNSPVLSIAAEVWARQIVCPGHRSPDHCQIPEQTGDSAGNMVLALPQRR